MVYFIIFLHLSETGLKLKQFVSTIPYLLAKSKDLVTYPPSHPKEKFLSQDNNY